MNQAQGAALFGQYEAMGLGNVDFEELLDGAARKNGLELAPVYYDLQPTNGQQVSSMRLTPDAGDGPLFVTRIDTSLTGSGTQGAELDVQIGSRKLTEGRCLVRDTFNFFTSQGVGRLALASPWTMPPLVIARGQTMTLTSDARTGASAGANDFVCINGFHLRRRRTHEKLGVEADNFARQWLSTVGEFYAVGLLSTSTQPYSSFNASYRARYGWLLQDSSQACSDIRWTMGGIPIVPRTPLVPSIQQSLCLRLGNLELDAPHMLEQRISTLVTPQAYVHFVGARILDDTTIMGG